ncbi:sigma-70 family RNA polymerase sigma factor [Noviherbaspirillum sedimenti]|uniref:Sigma-70 family RNA polymerase sigma factor n=1 Tax=Noviherbaspirillum sedimenti TaxID=2320865 RepID=A0A3A3G5C6_9BURK|nr:sigma-70 family RNA polymerase sigma factor [Noviherbaspirillum sedimenti]RJG03141.1 sigma-70 family RNA polymerase sigma factor [Noviherbaspirillum sedimenti]
MLTPITEQLESLRPVLLRFARLQLRNDAMADDVVQEALMAVLEKPDSYAGQSSLRTYVIGIMKHKIVDVLRHAGRNRQFDESDDASAEDLADTLFAADGHPLQRPRHWGNPDAALEQQDFFRVMELCLEKLPPKTARIFMMREWLELETEEICKELDISTSNAWVMLYRARLRLRECLDLHWFGDRVVQKKI